MHLLVKCAVLFSLTAAVLAFSTASAKEKASPFLLPDGKILGRSGQYTTVNGVKLYYEIHGQGEPLLLIHGDFGFVEMWKDTLPALMPHFKVIVPERRGHGRSYDAPGPYTYELFADDMAALLKALGVERAHVAGHSGGADTTLLMGYKYPQMVNRLVGISTWFNAAGYTYEALRETVDMTPETISPEIVRYWKKLNPMGPDHFPVFFEKMKQLQFDSPTLVPEDLKKVKAPMLLLMGDRDWVRFDHTITLFNSLSQNPDQAQDAADRQLAVIPGSGHMFPYEKPELVNRLILDFLLGSKSQDEFGGLFSH